MPPNPLLCPHCRTALPDGAERPGDCPACGRPLATPDTGGTPGAGAEAQSGLTALLDEQSRLWHAGEARRAEEFLRRHPGLRADREAVLQLLYHEILLRERRGEEVRPEEYLGRFPELAESLAAQFEVHRAMGAGDTSREGRADLGPWPAPTLGIGGEPQAAPPVVSGHEILSLLGHGRWGVVYQARHLRLGRVVALKMVLSGGHASPQELARFHEEARAIARLQHPNIIQIHEVGEAGGRPFLSLEYVGGGSLAQRLNGAPLPARQAAELIEVLARAVHHAHEHGVVHRDLKPANILIAPDGTPKVADFGLAKQVDAAAGQTQTGAILGTPSYMAPEQVGEAKAVGPAADVYALGAILYELLTGRPPFRAESLWETFEQVRGQEPVPVRRLQPKVPHDLETVCLKCLQKLPTRRYGSARDLADDLQRFLRGEPVLARPVGRLERAARWAKANSLVAGLAAVLVVVLVSSLGVIIWKWLEAEQHRGLAEDRAQAAERQKQQAQAARAAAVQARQKADDAEKLATGRANELEKTLYHHTLALTHHEFMANHPHRAEQLLLECKPEFRGWEWRYLQGAVQCHLLAFQAHSVEVSGLAYSPDGRYLASGAAFEGHRGYPGEVVIWDALSGRKLRTLRGHTESVDSVAFSPDGQRLASGSHDRTVKLWEVATGKLLFTLADHPNWVTGLAFSPDGKKLATASNADTRVWDSQTGKPWRAFDSPNGGIISLAFSPDGKQLAGASWSRRVVIWDAQSGRVLHILGHEADVRSVAYHPDSRRVASSDWTGLIKVWDTGPAGKELLSLRGHTDATMAVAFHPSGRSLASASRDGTVRIWDSASGQPLRTFRAHSGTAHSLAYSPDGSCLASGGQDGMVRVWDPDVDQGGRAVPVGIIWAGGLAFAKNSKWLAVADVLTNPLDPSTRPLAIRAFPGGSLLRTVGRREMALHDFAVDPSERTVALAGAEKTVELWSLATGRPVKALTGHSDAVTGVAFHPDDRTLASVSKDATLKLWDARAGRELFSYTDPGGELFAVAFSPDGRWLAFGGRGQVVQLWDTASRRKRFTLRGQRATVKRLAFSPDGALLASCGIGPDICLWDVSSGREFHRLRGHTTTVATVAFSPDGQRLVSASYADRGVKLWHVAEGKELLSLEAGNAFCAAFSPDGQYLVAGRNVTLRIWQASEVRPQDRARYLRSSAARSQTHFHTARGQWQQALRAFRELHGPRGPDGLDEAYEFAALLLLAGEGESYRQLCRDLVKRHGPTADARRAYLLARAGSLDARTPVDAEVVLRQALRAVLAAPRLAWHQHTLGMAYYRAGKYESALHCLRQALTFQSWQPRAVSRLGLALCYHRLGQPDKARQELDEAARWLDQELPKLPRAEGWGLPLHPHDWLACHALRAEAERLIRAAPPARGSARQRD